MFKRIFVALALACLSVRGVESSYRDATCPLCNPNYSDEYNAYLEKHAGHSHSMKKPKNSKSPKARSPSPSPSPSPLRSPSLDEDGNNGMFVHSIVIYNVQNLLISPARFPSIADTTIEVAIPEFQLNFTLANPETRRRLRIPFNAERSLHTDLEMEIYNLVDAYLFQKAKYPWPLNVNLEQSEATVGNETSSSIISTFKGQIELDELNSNITVTEIQAMMTELFDDKKEDFIQSVQKSEMDAMQRVRDVALSFTGNAGDGSGYSDPGYDGDLFNQPQDNDQPEDDDVPVGLVQNLEPSNHTASIAGASAAFAALAMFAYVYRKRNANEKEYELTGDFPDTIENDLDPTDSPQSGEHEMMRSLGIWKGTSLSGIAAAGPVRSGLSYLGAAAKSWSTHGSSMSDLAAGATQEEFVEHGMRVDIYGTAQKNKKPSKKRTQKVQMMLKKNSPLGGELSSGLEPIVEVNSAVSCGSSSANGRESWQQGNQEINDAPPLLPALSVSSAPSDETPLNDISNFSYGNALALPSIGTPDYDISFNTPMATPPYDSLNMEGMTPYGDMSGVSGSPNMSQNTNATKETPLQMRCLKFDTGGAMSDFSSSDKSDKSVNSCLKDMMDAINPNNSDSSSDGCVKDMLADIDGCAVKSVNDDSVSGSKLDENRGAKQHVEETQITHGAVKEYISSDMSATGSIEDSDMDQSFVCPPEVNVDHEKMIITDEVSGKSDGGSKDDVDIRNAETLQKVVKFAHDDKVGEENYDGVPLAELSGELSDSESDTISLITIDRFSTKE